MNTELLKKVILFRDMTDEELAETLTSLRAEERSYKKGELILHAGDPTERFALVLSGSVTIESNDLWGNRTILSQVGQGGFFAETYALLENEPMLVDVSANESSTILFLTIGSMGNLLQYGTSWSRKILTNLLIISTRKNLILSGRSFHTAPKTIRGRVMSYLNSVSLQKHSREFDIPFDRQQLADYLNLERSALSKELGKMQAEGMIETRKNHFILKEEMGE